MEANDFAALAAQIRTKVEAQGFHRLVGGRIDELAPGYAVLSVDRRPELLQQDGLLHGGVVAFLVDNATTIAAATLLRPGQAPLTAEYKLNLLAPATGRRIECRARVIRPGRSLSVVAADVFSLDGTGEPQVAATQVAAALATIAILSRPMRTGSEP